MKVSMHESVMIFNLVLQPKQKAWKGEGWKCNLRVTFTFLKMQKNVKEWVHMLPSGFPLWELESQRTSEYLKINLKGQNSLDWKVHYAIGNILKRRCLKWTRMIHLNIYNTSYGRHKGRKSKCQFDSRPLKVRNRPELRVWRGHAGNVSHIVGKFLTRVITFLKTSPQSEVYTKSYRCPKWWKS
jgi:hypothetical protein